MCESFKACVENVEYVESETLKFTKCVKINVELKKHNNNLHLVVDCAKINFAVPKQCQTSTVFEDWQISFRFQNDSLPIQSLYNC